MFVHTACDMHKKEPPGNGLILGESPLNFYALSIYGVLYTSLAL